MRWWFAVAALTACVACGEKPSTSDGAPGWAVGTWVVDHELAARELPSRNPEPKATELTASPSIERAGSTGPDYYWFALDMSKALRSELDIQVDGTARTTANGSEATKYRWENVDPDTVLLRDVTPYPEGLPTQDQVVRRDGPLLRVRPPARMVFAYEIPMRRKP